jgi:DNA-binding MarR family transcriptional regulator
MVGAGERQAMQEARIILGLLESMERDGKQTQRRLACELGVAVGLVNAYIKRCVKKGLLKVRKAPPRRFHYYLTPQGFAEKARLTVSYLAYSFELFRRARSEYCQLIDSAASQGFFRIALAGVSDLAEIATICALDTGTKVVAVVDPSSDKLTHVGVPVFESFDAVTETFDAVMVTALYHADEILLIARQSCGSHKVFFPPLLGTIERPIMFGGTR